MSEPVPVHVGLMGHIDHGKTELARALSEKVSTAGLDKHPQAKDRGITIDLGFSMFGLDHLLVTLVDAPGHADLIRSVVAGAGIIDAAIVVIAADKGPEIQTGEHVIVLKSMGVETVIPVITKIDLVNDERITEVKRTIGSVMRSAGYTKFSTVAVSAKTGEGMSHLKDTLQEVLEPSNRNTDADFMMPIDHAFPKKGHGTVVTGTVQRGRIQLGEMVELVPQRKLAKVRSIQVFGVPRQTAEAGDRIGVNIPDISDKNIKRGNYLAASNSLDVASHLIIDTTRNPLYKGRITKKMILNATIGMPSVTAELVPFQLMNGKRIILEETKDDSFRAALLLSQPVVVHPEMKVLLIRPDLPPTSMRIIGAGNIVEKLPIITLFRKKTKKGEVSRIRENDVLVEGIANSKRQAEKLVGQTVVTEHDISGKVIGPFGTRGVISVAMNGEVKESERVYYLRFIEEEYSFGD